MEARSPTRGLYGQRPSKSADAARRDEFAQIEAMTPEERMLRALALRRRLGAFSSVLGSSEPQRGR